MALGLAVSAITIPFLALSDHAGNGSAKIVASLYGTAAVVVSIAAYRGGGSVLCVFDEGILLVDGPNDARTRIVYWRERAHGLTRQSADIYVNGLFVVVEETVLFLPGDVRLPLDRFERRTQLRAEIEAGIARGATR